MVSNKVNIIPNSTSVVGGRLEQISYNGMTCLAYIPTNANSNTQIFTYFHGGGTGHGEAAGEQQDIINYQLSKFGSNSIVLMPTQNERWGNKWGDRTMDIVEYYQGQYNITNDNVTTCSYSWGTFGGYETTTANIKRNPSSEPQIITMIDNYSDQGNGVFINEVLTDDALKSYADNDTIVMSFVQKNVLNAVSPTNSTTIHNKMDELHTLVNAGVKVVVVEYNSTYYDHQGIKNDFFNYNFIDYANGTGKLSSDAPFKYYVAKKDAAGKIVWEEINKSEISSRDDLYNFFEVGNLPDLETYFKKMDDTKMVELKANINVINGWSGELLNHLNNLNNRIQKINTICGNINDSWESIFAEGFSSSLSNKLKKINDDQAKFGDMQNYLDGYCDKIKNI